MVDIEVSQETTNRLHAILSGLGKADEKSDSRICSRLVFE